MTFDFKKMFESKRALRRKLAGLPVAEKLAMLDALREREVALRKAAASLQHPVVSETSAPYRSERDGKKGSTR